jgi:hypothetical protein
MGRACFERNPAMPPYRMFRVRLLGGVSRRTWAPDLQSEVFASLLFWLA